MVKIPHYISEFFDHNTVDILKLTLAIKISLLLFIYFFHSLIPFNQMGPKLNYYYKPASFKLGELLSAWDGQWYQFLTENGYKNTPQGIPQYMHFAFAPLYPILVRSISQITSITPDLSSIILNLIIGIFGITVFYKLVSLDYNQKISHLAALFFLINPAAIFYLAHYTETLFFTLIVSAFYLVRKSKWLMAGLVGALASTTRIQGFLLLLPLSLEAFLSSPYLSLKNRINFKSQPLLKTVSLLLIPTGLILFMLYSNSLTEDPLIITHTHQYFNRANPSLFLIPQTLFKNLILFDLLPNHGIFKSKIDTATMWLFVIATILMIKTRMRLSYILLSLIFLAAPLATGSTMSLTRALSTAFPLYILLGMLGSTRPNLTYSLVFISIAFATLFSLLYVNWYWVA